MIRVDAGWHPVLAEVSLMLLDFDGPVVRLLPGPDHLHLAHDMVRWCADRTGISPEVAAVDHVAVLRHIHQHHPELAAEAESMATISEMAAAESRKAYPDAVATMNAWLANGGRLAVVSNNAEQAVRLVLDRADLPASDSGSYSVHARRSDAISQLKPKPDLLLQAMELHGVPAARSIMIGDTVGDVDAGQAAGVPTIGMAETHDRADQLKGAGAVAVVTRLVDLRNEPR